MITWYGRVGFSRIGEKRGTRRTVNSYKGEIVLKQVSDSRDKSPIELDCFAVLRRVEQTGSHKQIWEVSLLTDAISATF